LQGNQIIQLTKGQGKRQWNKKKLKGSGLLFISFTDMYRKKRGSFIGHENIGVYKFYPKHVEDNIK